MKIVRTVFLCLTLLGCSQDYLPKPKGYNRIILPQAVYQSLPDTLPYTFEYSQHALLRKDNSWLSERYWIDLYYPYFDADIQITYKPILDLDSLMKGYYSDSYKLTSHHNIKAYSIEEKILELPNGDYASLVELEGEVPTQVQFHVSDSNTHFLRGALYFKTATQNDSLAPVIQFIKGDVIHMLRTLRWTDE